MFLKKRPPDLPKSPDLEKVKDFSLFGARRSAAASESAPAEAQSRFRSRVPEEDVIDVEVVERVDRPLADAVPAATPQPESETEAAASSASAPAPAQAEFEPRPAAPDSAASAGAPAAKPGLKILRKTPAEPTVQPSTSASAQVQAPLEDAPADANSPSAATTASSWKDRLKAGLAKQPKPEAAPAEPAAAPSAASAAAAVEKGRSFAKNLFAKAATKPAAADETPAAPASQSKAWAQKFGRARDPQAATAETSEPAVQAQEPEKPAKNNPLSRFARKATEPSAQSEQNVAAEPQSRFSLGAFALGSKAKPEGKKTKKVKPVDTARTGAPRGAVDVLIELEGNRRVFWRVTAQNFEELPAERVRKAVSFSRNEHRFHVEGAMGFNGAQDLALAEVGEDVRIVNASRAVNAVYASTAQRIAELQPVTVGPGLQLIDELLLKERKSGEEMICGLILKGASESQSLAVLYHFTDQDEVAATQITVNPDNLNFVLAQFASSRRLEVADTKVILFNNEDLLKVAAKIEYYPAEAVWRGVPVRVVLWTATAVAAGAAGLCGLYAAQAYVRVAAAQSKVSSASAEQKKVQKSIDELLTSSVVSFAHSQSLNLAQMTERAGEFWTPGAKVVVDATARTETYNITLPLTRGGLMGNRPSVLHQLNLGHVEPLLKKEPPEGCAKAMPEVSGGLNAVQVTITCESTSSALSGYRLD